MIKNIALMRKELEGFEQVPDPLELKKGCQVKYLILKNEEQCLCKGGKFVNLGNNCVILKNKSRSWSVPISELNPDGSVKHQTIFFTKEESEENCDKQVQELQDIIRYQQSIIEKMTKTITELEIQKKHLTHEKIEYEELLQQNRYNMKEICIESREKDKKIEQYEGVIQKLANSHQMFQ
tara:strand:+ start:567 stop:1106 length:540 start_codon:yes stop_codon:yes gene_type:complete